VTQHFKSGAFAAILETRIGVDRSQSLKVGIFLGQHNLHLPLMRPHPRGNLASLEPSHIMHDFGTDHIKDEHRSAR
jgi:hypothetical protein